MSASPSVTADRELIVSRMIDAPRALVFAAWTDPQQVPRWWGPKGFVTTFSEMDIRQGGTYRVCMRGPDGVDRWKRGVYQEIVAPERIVFTFAWEDGASLPTNELLTTVTFEEFGTKTRLTLKQHLFETIEGRDSHETGWTSCLERFAEYMTTA